MLAFFLPRPSLWAAADWRLPAKEFCEFPKLNPVDVADVCEEFFSLKSGGAAPAAVAARIIGLQYLYTVNTGRGKYPEC